MLGRGRKQHLSTKIKMSKKNPVAWKQNTEAPNI
uniref:Uncharacterized protein n=1 Tax=Rhizophora mucronata TaxID=61149 RepID=A0A2P2NSI7_RHIMU